MFVNHQRNRADQWHQLAQGLVDVGSGSWKKGSNKIAHAIAGPWIRAFRNWKQHGSTGNFWGDYIKKQPYRVRPGSRYKVMPYARRRYRRFGTFRRKTRSSAFFNSGRNGFTTKIGRKRKFRRFRRGRYTNKLKRALFRYTVSQIPTNIYRRLAFSSIQVQNNRYSRNTQRLFNWNYDPTGGFGSAAQIDHESLPDDANAVYTNLKGILPVNLGQDAAAKTNLDLQDLRIEQYNGNNDPIIRLLYTKCKATYTFRNNSSIPVTGILYFFEAKHDIPATSSGDSGSDLTPISIATNYIGNTGIATVSNVGIANVFDEEIVSKLGDARHVIKAWWKFKRVVVKTLQPGDELIVHLSMKKRIINMKILMEKMQKANAIFGLYAAKGEPILTSFWHGPIAHDVTTNANVGWSGQLTTAGAEEQVDFQILKEFHIKLLSTTGREFYHYVTDAGTLTNPTIAGADVDMEPQQP